MINCQECQGQRRVLFVQRHPGKLPEYLSSWGLSARISNHPAWRLHWRNCPHCYGDGVEDDPDHIRIHLQELKERLRAKHKPQS